MAWFKHSCFVSYRHGQQSIKEQFIRRFHDSLSAELELFRKEDIYVDYERLKGGTFIESHIALGIYESACMVMVYHPTYFDHEHLYCAREYRAMVTLERQRLAQVSSAAARAQGLIIPVILRGKDTLPAELSAQRMYEDFSKFMLADLDNGIKSYANHIKRIAEYIHERCVALEGIEMAMKPDEFVLPSNNSVSEWLNSLDLPKARFPGTET
jgi:hypothetical protein